MTVPRVRFPGDHRVIQAGRDYPRFPSVTLYKFLALAGSADYAMALGVAEIELAALLAGSGDYGLTARHAPSLALSGAATYGMNARNAPRAPFAVPGDYLMTTVHAQDAALSGVADYSFAIIPEISLTAAFGATTEYVMLLDSELVADFVASGEYGMDAKVATPAAFSGSGSYPATTMLTSSAPFSGSGAYGVTSEVANTAAFSGDAAYSFTLAEPGDEMGMDKSGTQTIAQSAWTKVTSFTVRAGYPATTITGSALEMNGDRTGTVTFRGDFGSGGLAQQFRAYLNGSPIGSAVNKATVGTVPSVSVVDGDLIELWAYCDSGSASPRTVSSGSTETYIYIT